MSFLDGCLMKMFDSLIKLSFTLSINHSRHICNRLEFWLLILFMKCWFYHLCLFIPTVVRNSRFTLVLNISSLLPCQISIFLKFLYCMSCKMFTSHKGRSLCLSSIPFLVFAWAVHVSLNDYNIGLFQMKPLAYSSVCGVIEEG